MIVRAFLGLPVSLVCLELFLAAFQGHGLVTSSSRQRNSHGLVEQREALSFLHGSARAFWIVKDDEGLTFRLQILLRDDIDNIAKLGEYGSQGFCERLNLDALFEILNVDPI